MLIQAAGLAVAVLVITIMSALNSDGRINRNSSCDATVEEVNKQHQSSSSLTAEGVQVVSSSLLSSSSAAAAAVEHEEEEKEAQGKPSLQQVNNDDNNNNDNNSNDNKNAAARSPSLSTATRRQQQELERIAGTISGDFACIYAGTHHGTLYAGSLGLYFCGTFLFFERKVFIPWDDVRLVSKNGPAGSIDIWMKDDSSDDSSASVHAFTGMHSPPAERVWVLLVSLHNDALLDHSTRRIVKGGSGGDGGMGTAGDSKEGGDDLATSMGDAVRGAGGESGSDIDNASRHMRRRSRMSVIPGLGESMLIKRSNSDPSRMSIDANEWLAASTSEDDAVATAAAAVVDTTSTSNMEANAAARYGDGRVSISLAAANAAALAQKQDVVLASAEKEDVEYKVGVLRMQPIPCTYQNDQGKLYAGTSGLYFYGRKFFWDVNVLMTFRSIKQFQILTSTAKSTSKDLQQTDQQKPCRPKSIGITVLTKDGTVHDFCDMGNPDQVWAGLVALQNENLTATAAAACAKPPLTHAKSQQQQQASRSKKYPYRRTNSDPLMSSHLQRTDTTLSEIMHDESDDVIPESETAKQASATSASSSASSDDGHPSVVDFAEEWAAVVAQKKDYSNLVIDNRVLPNCTLGKYYDLFIKHQADFSIAKYLEGRGDSELKESEWKQADDSSNNETRVVHYMHPVNVPMAPPQAVARKEQIYRRYGDHGLCVETRTYVEDVPMTDCFYVADRIRVEPNPDKENEESPSVVVSMEFEITFVKSTMFRGIIGKTTASEFKTFFQELVTFMSEALSRQDSAATTKVVEGPGETKASTVIEPQPKQQVVIQQEPQPQTFMGIPLPPTPVMMMIMSGLLGLVTMFQFYIFMELRGIKQALRARGDDCPTSSSSWFRATSASTSTASSTTTDQTCTETTDGTCT